MFPTLSVDARAAAAPVIAARRPAPAVSPQELEAVRERGRAEGFEAGLREGRAVAYGEWSSRLGHTMRALEEAARALLASRVELAAQVERRLPKLVLELTRKVIHQELSHAQTAAQTVVRALSERLAGCERPVVVRLSPEMAEAFEAWRRTDDGPPLAGPGVRLELDGELAPGEWVLQVGDGFLDGRVESQLDEAWRLIAELPR